MSKTLITGVAVAAALAVVALFFVFGNPFMALDTNPLGAAGAPDTSLSASGDTSSLVVQDETVGTGDVATPGETVTVNYTGKFQNGTVFDTSVGKQPYSFVLGAGNVIPGWDQGLQGMKVGGKRLLIVPPSLGYGSTDYGPIPANSTLIFEVELLSVKK